MNVKILFFVFAILSLAKLTLASQTANVALFIDAKCANAASDPWSISMPFSPQCQSLPTTPPRSLILDCDSDNKQQNTNFTFMMYNNSATCSSADGGDLQLGLQSYGSAGACLPTTMSNGDKQYQLYSIVKCVTNTANHERRMKLKSVGYRSTSECHRTARGFRCTAWASLGRLPEKAEVEALTQKVNETKIANGPNA